jgi:hypothetical protein
MQHPAEGLWSWKVQREVRSNETKEFARDVFAAVWIPIPGIPDMERERNGTLSRQLRS